MLKIASLRNGKQVRVDCSRTSYSVKNIILKKLAVRIRPKARYKNVL
jgi:hypothetical protein